LPTFHVKRDRLEWEAGKTGHIAPVAQLEQVGDLADFAKASSIKPKVPPSSEPRG
jgi:hypothetical protein